MTCNTKFLSPLLIVISLLGTGHSAFSFGFKLPEILKKGDGESNEKSVHQTFENDHFVFKKALFGKYSLKSKEHFYSCKVDVNKWDVSNEAKDGHELLIKSASNEKLSMHLFRDENTDPLDANKINELLSAKLSNAEIYELKEEKVWEKSKTKPKKFYFKLVDSENVQVMEGISNASFLGTTVFYAEYPEKTSKEDLKSVESMLSGINIETRLAEDRGLAGLNKSLASLNKSLGAVTGNPVSSSSSNNLDYSGEDDEVNPDQAEPSYIVKEYVNAQKKINESQLHFAVALGFDDVIGDLKGQQLVLNSGKELSSDEIAKAKAVSDSVNEKIDEILKRELILTAGKKQEFQKGIPPYLEGVLLTYRLVPLTKSYLRQQKQNVNNGALGWLNVVANLDTTISIIPKIPTQAFKVLGTSKQLISFAKANDIKVPENEEAALGDLD